MNPFDAQVRITNEMLHVPCVCAQQPPPHSLCVIFSSLTCNRSDLLCLCVGVVSLCPQQEQPDQVPTPPPPPLVLAALACDVGQITDLLSKNADIKEKVAHP